MLQVVRTRAACCCEWGLARRAVLCASGEGVVEGPDEGRVTPARGPGLLQSVLGKGVVGECTILKRLKELRVLGRGVSGVADAAGEGVREKSDNMGPH